MRAAPQRTGLPAATVFAIALIAAGIAPAGELAVPPLPGAAGGSDPAAPADGAAGLAAGIAPADAAGIAEAGRPAAAQDAADGEPPVLLSDMGAEGAAAVDADGVHGADGESRDATGGSRLLRALAQRPEPGAAPRADGAVGAAPPFAAEGCPRALLRRLLAGAASEADALTALGIEREVLTLCRERQEIVTGLFVAEARLRELRTPVEAPVEAAPAAAAPRKPAPAVRESAAPRPAQPSPLRAALAGTALAGTAEAGTEAAPRYGWFSIIGTAGALRAGVTDGTGVWFVHEGDALPGGGTVAAISGRPPAVRMAGADGGARELLPYRARPGGGP